jgi:hypothetical protein
MFGRMMKAFSARPTSPKPLTTIEQTTINQRSSAVFDLSEPSVNGNTEPDDSFDTFSNKDSLASVEMENPMLNR